MSSEERIEREAVAESVSMEWRTTVMTAIPGLQLGPLYLGCHSVHFINMTGAHDDIIVFSREKTMMSSCALDMEVARIIILSTIHLCGVW